MHAPSAYALAATQPGSAFPVTYDPCRPIEVVVAAGDVPADWYQLTDGALDVLSEASGLSFRPSPDLTAEQLGTARNAFQPNRYGSQWAPVVFATSGAPILGDGDLAGLERLGRAPCAPAL